MWVNNTYYIEISRAESIIQQYITDETFVIDVRNGSLDPISAVFSCLYI